MKCKAGSLSAEYPAVAVLGGIGYNIVELLWRGRTHPTMTVAGGLCALIIYRVQNRPLPAVKRAVICAAGITAAEFVFGMIFNRLLNMKVWDYSSRRFNLFGQICPLYSGIWLLLSAVLGPVARRIKKHF